YSPNVSSGIWVPYTYATELLYDPVITAFSAGGGAASITTQSYVKEIDFHSGIAPDEVRLTLTGSQGNMSLQIHIDALEQTFTIPYFETGKSIHGLAVYDSSLHAWVQGSSSGAFSSSGSGVFTGSFHGGSTPSISTSGVDVTYYLQSLHFA